MQWVVLVLVLSISGSIVNVFGEAMMINRCCNERLANSSTKPYPRVSSDSGRFKIALFADLHYGENSWTDWGPAQDVKSEIVMSRILDAEKPGGCVLQC